MRIVVICGPTASGKTALAVELGEQLGAEIVSADSQQCYRGLDAGTAKPTPAERARVPHHLLDVAEPEEQLDAARFVKLADAAVADIVARGRRVIVAGGTGLWIRALVRGLVQAPAASPELREELRRKDVSDLHAMLQSVDQVSARRILPRDRVRIERALEVHALSGRRLSDLQAEHAFADARYDALTLHLEPPREVLAERIARRTRRLFESGELRRETEWLLRRKAPRALKIIGYGEMAEALQTGDFAAAEERVNARTRQYAKRQRSWFLKDAGPPAGWPLDPQGLCGKARQWYER